MITRVFFEYALVVVSAALVVMLAAIVVIKTVREARDRQHERMVQEVRPAVLSALEDGTTSLEFKGRRNAVAQSLAISLLPKLRGSDRDQLAQLLDAGGLMRGAVKKLRSPIPSVRRRSAELLGSAGYVEAGPQLMKLLHDRNAVVRASAARSLGMIGQPEFVPALFNALSDRRVSANTASMAILRIGGPGEDGVLEALGRQSGKSRAIAAELAGSMGILAALPLLELGLNESDSDLSESCARAIGRLSSPRSSQRLIDLLERQLSGDLRAPEERLAIAVAEALGRIGDRAAIPVLEASLTRRRGLSAAAGEALVAMGQRRSRRSSADREKAELVTESQPVDVNATAGANK